MNQLLIQENKSIDNLNNYFNNNSNLRTYYGPFHRIKSYDKCVKVGEKCVICLNEYEKGTYKRTLSCNHLFHKKCIDKWFRGFNKCCPICRQIHIV